MRYTLKPIYLAIATGLSITACTTNDARVMQPTHRINPVKVAESVERLELYSRPNGMELSARDEYAVRQFFNSYAQHGSGPIYINRPSGHEGGLGITQTNRVLQQLMVEAGLSPSAMQTGEYQSTEGDPAPVIVSYRTLRTIVQDCGRLSDLSLTSGNGVHPEFGCFASANLAAMISDPRQLIQPYDSDPPNAQRRQVIYDKYIAGEPTGATRPADQQISSQESAGG